MKYASGIFCIFSALVLIPRVSSQLTWDKSYTLKAVLRIPSAEIEEPYQIWADGDSGNVRIDFYDGLDKLYRLNTPSGEMLFYKIRPESIENNPSRYVCKVFQPTDYLVQVYNKSIYLPSHKFKRVGSEQIENVQTTKWVYGLGYKRDGLEFQHKYTMWVKSDSPVNVPVRYEFQLNVDGKDMDYLRHDYTYFDSAKPDPQIFNIPSSVHCNLQAITSLHEPLDPIMEYVNPTVEDERVSKAFDSFKLEHNKTYTDFLEHHERKFIFKNNLRLINSVNRQHKSYSLAVNKFADLNDAELANLNALHVTPIDYGRSDDDDDIVDEDENVIGDNINTFDWRDFNAISPIKDQTSLCGSCYAFTSAATIESTLFIYSGCRGQVKEVSEQAIVDCTWRGSGNHGNSGCDSGDLVYTLSYIKKFGVPTKDSYGPYLAMEGVCRSKEAGKKFKISGFQAIAKKEKAIQKALVTNGPLALAINGNSRTFLFYSKGLYNNENCGNRMEDLSHGVTLIGFGEEAGQEYWILKNSYGTQWGENGFMRIATKNNICGVMNYVFSVEFKKKNRINKCFLKHKHFDLDNVKNLIY